MTALKNSILKKWMRPFLRFLQKIGMDIQPFQTVAEFRDLMDRIPVEEREMRINDYGISLQRTGNHHYYDELLNYYIPDCPVGMDSAEFVGKGSGQGSLSSYRKIKSGKETYFEKIYFTDSEELKALLWFDEHIRPLLGDEIKVPGIKKICPGDFLTAIYFEYITIEKVDDPATEIRRVMQALYKLSEEHKNLLAEKQLPEYIVDFRTHFRYVKYRTRAEKAMKSHGVDIAALEQEISNSKRIFTHGDLNISNLAKGIYLIDWDAFGIYPIGLEAAHVFYRLYLRENKYVDRNQWLGELYGDIVAEEDWAELKRNFDFFLFVFAGALFDAGKYVALEEEIVMRVKGEG